MRGTTMTMLNLRQRSPEWLEARRHLITATDIPIILGLSPYSCEADLADIKRGLAVEENLPMRLGTFLQPFILEEYERQTGRRAVAIHTMRVHPQLPWAAASPDGRVIGSPGERILLELKYTSQRARFKDGVPDDIAAQVAWQLGVTGYPMAHVVALASNELEVFPVPANPALFDNLVTIAEDFRSRLADGGPFRRDLARVNRDHPTDDGSALVADADTAEAVRALLDVKASIKRSEETARRLELAVKDRMGDHAVLTGDGFKVTWKQIADSEIIEWDHLAEHLLAGEPEEKRLQLRSMFTVTRPGTRRFLAKAASEGSTDD